MQVQLLSHVRVMSPITIKFISRDVIDAMTGGRGGERTAGEGRERLGRALSLSEPIGAGAYFWSWLGPWESSAHPQRAARWACELNLDIGITYNLTTTTLLCGMRWKP